MSPIEALLVFVLVPSTIVALIFTAVWWSTRSSQPPSSFPVLGLPRGVDRQADDRMQEAGALEAPAHSEDAPAHPPPASAAPAAAPPAEDEQATS